MKYLALAMFLAVMQAPPPVPRKAADAHAPSSQRVQENSQGKQEPAALPIAVEKPVGTQEAKQNCDKVEDANKSESIRISEPVTVSVAPGWSDKTALAFSGVLVVAGCLGVCAAVKTLKAIRVQAHEMKHQRRAMRGQLVEMKRQVIEMGNQTGMLEKSVKAAQDSANAAKDNIELIIKKERAKIRIEIGPLFVNAALPDPPVTYKIHTYGPTEAFIQNSQVVMYVSDSKWPSRDAFGLSISIPDVIIPNSPAIEIRGYLLHIFTKPEIENIRKKDAFVHFQGFIQYKDRFERDRETRFSKVWEITDLKSSFGSQEPFALWMNCGESDDNKED